MRDVTKWLVGVGVVIIVVVMGGARSAEAWHQNGHALMTRAAVFALPDDMPTYFREGVDAIAHNSTDPDLMRDPRTPQLRAAESPEHFFDLELLQGRPVPDNRRAFILLCAELGVDPAAVGYVSYAAVEHAQRLAIVFAEHRRWPENPHIRAKSLLYAGLMAHYAQDLVQPLHVTIHYDGRMGEDGKSPRTGIHMKVDALVGRLTASPQELATMVRPQPADDLFAHTVAILMRAHELVDVVYELEPTLETQPMPRELSRFTYGRAQAGARLTTDLWLSAWRLSEAIETPGWLSRVEDGGVPAQPEAPEVAGD